MAILRLGAHLHATHLSHERAAQLALRIALGSSFLSAVADRFGIWGLPGAPHVAWGNFDQFSAYTGHLLWMLPPSAVVALAWVATVLETALGIALLFGWRTDLCATLSGILLSMFALSMLFAFGPKPPLDASVFTAAAAAFLLGSTNGKSGGKSEPVSWTTKW